VQANTILNASHYGIYIGVDSVNNMNDIINNTVSFCNNGIYLTESSQNNITGNNVSWNSIYGIFIYSSSNNTVNNNYVAYNGWGISLNASSDNRLYHNHIINNTNQARDDSDNGNQWDNGYPSGGNYWSDYSGKDLYSGPNQDIPGDDGIGDTNYSIDSDSRDNYPFMGEIGDHLFLYEGWNLISLPFIQSITDLSSVLSSISGFYDAVQWYDINDTNDPWKHSKVGKPFGNDMFELKETMGFWIKIIDTPGVIFEYPGVAPSVNQTISLKEGWNLVGYPSLSNHNRTEGLNNLIFNSQVDAIQWYDAYNQTWHFMGSDDLFVRGRGYWIHSLVETTWDVPI
jgi:parallel beta-helix repeat protein